MGRPGDRPSRTLTIVRLHEQIRYEAGPDLVFAMVTDQDFQDLKCQATGALSHAVTIVTTADGGAVVTTTRVLPTDTMSDAVRGFLGASLNVTQVETWGPSDTEGGRHGTVTVDIAGAPVRFRGTISLRIAGEDPSSGVAAGTVETVDGELKASVPFIGPSVEKAAAPAISSAIKVEQECGTAWLSER
jgi:hypothetical protein